MNTRSLSYEIRALLQSTDRTAPTRPTDQAVSTDHRPPTKRRKIDTRKVAIALLAVATVAHQAWYIHHQADAAAWDAQYTDPELSTPYVSSVP